jgi:hypothetical protein
VFCESVFSLKEEVQHFGSSQHQADEQLRPFGLVVLHKHRRQGYIRSDTDRNTFHFSSTWTIRRIGNGGISLDSCLRLGRWANRTHYLARKLPSVLLPFLCQFFFFSSFLRKIMVPTVHEQKRGHDKGRGQAGELTEPGHEAILACMCTLLQPEGLALKSRTIQDTRVSGAEG